MSELRIPTIALPTEVLCADGRRFAGRIFVPASAHRHDGPMRPEEWINDRAHFFPFLPDGADAPVLLNKREVLVLTVPASPDDATEAAGVPNAVRQVAVEAEEQRLEGSVVIDMPEGHQRVLDYLNRDEPFLSLRDREKQHLVQKERVTRVIEAREA